MQASNTFSPSNFIDFLKNGNLVNPSFTGSIRKLYQPSDDQFVTDISDLLDSGCCPIQAFYLKQVKINNHENYSLCPALNFYISKDFQYNKEYPWTISSKYVARFLGTEAQTKWINFCAQYSQKQIKFNNWFEENEVIWGYYFPYKTNHIKIQDNTEDSKLKPTVKKIESEMGYVDIPKISPPYDFVFTGQMNGCDLIVSESPYNNHYRVWHYQSPGDNPVYTYDNFPLKVYAWISSNSYAGDVKNDEVSAFNFLYYDKSQKLWVVYSQPQKYRVVNDLVWKSFLAEKSSKENFLLPIKNPIEQPISIKTFSESNSLFPNQQLGFNYAFSDEPILLNGMKVLFDNPTPTTPVTLQPKQRGTNNGR